jgi:DNA-binding PadR family transcriptional regulator
MPALTAAVFHILLALADGERHGYGILKEVLRHTDGAVRLGPGTIYGTLQRLMESGWVEESDGPTTAVDERRRHYRLTRSGRQALEAEVQRMEGLVRAARSRRVGGRTARG